MGGLASSEISARIIFSMAGVKKNLTPYLRRAVTGRKCLERAGNSLLKERQSRREGSRLRVVRMGISVRAVTLAAFGRTLARDMV